MNNQGNFPNMGMRSPMNSGQNMQQQMLMMEQMMNSGNAGAMLNMFQSNLQTMNPQQRAMFMENFQRNFMMMQQQSAMQSQGMMGNGNAGMLNMMQEVMQMQGPQMGSQQGFMGSGNSQMQNMNQAMPLQQGGNQGPMMPPAHIQPSTVINPGNAASINKNPSVSAQSSSVSSNQSAQSGPPKLKGILKKPQNASTSTDKTVNNSASQNQASSNSDQQKTLLESLYKQTSATLSALKGSLEKSAATGTSPSVPTNSSVSTTSPIKASSVDSSAKIVKSILKPSTSQQISKEISSTSSEISKTASQTESASVTSQSKQTSKIEGQGKSIPTLVSSGMRKQREPLNKRKAEVDIATKNKKVKVMAEPVPVMQSDMDEEDPEHVQAQVFISNIPNNTSKEMILEVLLHYKFIAPKVWIGYHNSLKDKICAFVKLPSLKDSKRVISEMNGFPYKGLPMEIRFSAAADFMDYTVPHSGLPLPNMTSHSLTTPAPVLDTSVPPPAVISHTIVEPVPVAVPVDPVTFAPVPVPVYAGVPPGYLPQVGYGAPQPERPDIESDRRSVDSYDASTYRRDFRRSASPRDRRGHSQHSQDYSPKRERHHSPYESRGRHSSPEYSSRRRLSQSPDYPSKRRYSRSPDISSQRRYSRSPESSSNRRYSRSPEYSSARRYSRSPSSYRRGRSPDSYVSQSREQDHFALSRHHSDSPDYSAKERLWYDQEEASLDDSRRARELSDYHGNRIHSLSPNRSYRDSPYRERSPARLHGAENMGPLEIFCVHLENLPTDIQDSELEDLIKRYAYDRVQLKVRDDKAIAKVYVGSSTEAKMIVHELDSQRYLGCKLSAGWFREDSVSVRPADIAEHRDQSSRPSDCERSRLSSDKERTGRLPEKDRSPKSQHRSKRESSRELERSFVKKEKTLFQRFIDESYPNAPVLGRRYIKEFSSKGSSNAFYLCILCEVTLTSEEIADHMMSYKHRLKCIKRSHPRIYDEICSTKNKVDKLGQCAKYALQLENAKERVAQVDTPTPEVTARQHLKKITGDRARDVEKKEVKVEKGKSTDEKDEDTSDSTTDIFKKIAAFKKKYEASKETSSDTEETPAKKPRTAVRKKSTISFRDLAKKNKPLADSIQKEITSARQGFEKMTEEEENKKTLADISKKVEEFHKKSEQKLQDAVNKKTEEERKEKEKKLQDRVARKRERDAETSEKKLSGDSNKMTEDQSKMNEKKLETSGNKKIQVETAKNKKRNTGEQRTKTELSSEKAQWKSGGPPQKVSATTSKEEAKQVKTVIDLPSDKKEGDPSENPNKSKDKVIEILNEPRIDEEVIVIDSDKDGSEKGEESNDGKEIVKNKEVNEHHREGLVKDMVEMKEIEKDKDKELEKEKKQNVKEREESNEVGNDELEDLTIDPEDIKDLEKSLSPELFGEELGDMEEEEVVEEKTGLAEEKISSHPKSMLKKYLDIQLLKYPDNSGIIGLQYITEVISDKGTEAYVFKCSLCEVKCARNTIVNHIMGYKHRMKYFEVHHFDIYSNIMKMDKSHKFLNAECIRFAKLVQEREGLKTIMTVSESDFKQKEKEVKQEQKSERKVMSETHVGDKAGQKLEQIVEKTGERTRKPSVEKKLESPEVIEVIDMEKSGNIPASEPKETADSIKEIIKMATTRPHAGLGQKIREAKAAAKLVSRIEGRETVELYKYIQQKPDVPLLGLSNVTEIQGLYGANCKTSTYCCELCLPQTKIDGTASIYEHLTGIKHMENYLKKQYPHKMIHLKLLTQHSAKTMYLHNQAKLLCQGQLKQPESIYMVNIAQMEEEKKALALAQAAAKAEEEAAKAEAEALAAAAAAEQATMATQKAMVTKSKGSSTPEEVIDLTGEEVKCEPPVAHLYKMIAGLKDIPLVGLSYITEIQGILAEKAPLCYECRLCDNEMITANYINAHITGSLHRLKFLKTNYPVFYSKAEFNKDLADKFCRDIEEQFGRESISVKKRILVNPDGSVVYSDPCVVRAPLESKETEKETEQDVMDTIEKMDEIEKGEIVEKEDIYFYKIAEGLDCTPMLGLQYIREIQHPTINELRLYECDVCNIKNGPFLNAKNILKHICSKDHRLKFMKENHFHLFQEITSLKTEEQRKVAIDKHTKEIESKVGRGLITKVISNAQSYWCNSNQEKIIEESKLKGPSEMIQKNNDSLVADEDQPQYICKKCTMIVARDRRREHISAVHLTAYRCRLCKLSFPNHFYIQKHVNKHHERGTVVLKKKLFENHNLNKWFGWYSEKGGQLEQDPTGKLRLICKQCHVVVKPDETKKHYVYYHIKGYKCRLCNQHHGTNTDLEKHLQLRHHITQNVPVENYMEGIKLSTKFVTAYSLKPPDPADMKKLEKPVEVVKPEDQKKKSTGIQKYTCTRCFSLFRKEDLAKKHYKASHFFEYPCSMCKLVFRTASQLKSHLSYSHRVNRHVDTPMILFEKCFDILTDDGQKMSLVQYMKQNPEKVVAEQSQSTIATVTTSAVTTYASASAVDVVTMVTATAPSSVTSAYTTSSVSTVSAATLESVSVTSTKTNVSTSATRPETVTVSSATSMSVSTTGRATEGSVQQVKVPQSKDDQMDETKASKPSDNKASGTVDIGAVFAAKEGEQFDWDTEYAKIQERKRLGGIITTARKSKFMINYTATFSNYPLIGLQFVTEFQQRDISALPWYICELCKDRILWNGITAHIASNKHRIKYLEEHHQVLHSMVTQRQFATLESLTAKVETLAQGVVKKEGKKFNMTVLIELPPSEAELKALAAISSKTKAMEGCGLHKDTAGQSVLALDKDKRSASASTDQQHSSKHGESKSEEQKKKLPTWVKIPRSSGKTDQPKSTSFQSTAKYKENDNDKKVEKTDVKKGIEHGRVSLYSGSGKQPEGSDSKKRERSSGRSPRRTDDERSSKERRIHRAERRSERNYSKDRRRSTSRDKDKRDSKSPRSGRNSSARSKKDSDRRSSKDTPRGISLKSDDAVKNKTSPVKVVKRALEPVSVASANKNEIVLKGPGQPEEVRAEIAVEDTLEVTEVGLSQEELEQIGKCIEEQMTDDDLILVDDIKECKTETEISQVKGSDNVDTDTLRLRPKEPTIEIATENENNLSLKKEWGKEDKAVTSIITEEAETLGVKQESSDNCVIEITVAGSSPEKLTNINKKTDKASSKVTNNTATKSCMEINIDVQTKDFNQKTSYKEQEVLVPEIRSKPRDSFTLQRQTSDMVVSDVNTEMSGSNVNRNPQKNIGSQQEETVKALNEEKISNEGTESCDTKMTVDKVEENMVTDIDEIDTDADMMEFITSELGEDFVTVDDLQDSSPDMSAENDLSDKCESKESVTNQDILEKTVQTQNDNRIAINETFDKRSLVINETKEPKMSSEADNSSEKCKVSFDKKDSEIDKTTKCLMLPEMERSEIEEKCNVALGNLSENETLIVMKSDGNVSSEASNGHLEKSGRDFLNNQDRSANETQNISDVCVVEVSMEPSNVREISNLSKFNDADEEPYDDSGDMEFILTDEFLSADEIERRDTEYKFASDEKKTEQVVEETTSSSNMNMTDRDLDKEPKQNLTFLPVDQDTGLESVNKTKQKEAPVSKLQLEDDTSSVKPQDKVSNPISKEDNSAKTSDEIITTFSMSDDDDDDDIEEIFIGGDFVTVDTVDEDKEETVSPVDTVDEDKEETVSPVDTVDEDKEKTVSPVDTVVEDKEKTVSPVEDTAAEECADEFVTVDEVDADIQVDEMRPSDEKHHEKSLHENTNENSARTKNRCSSSRSSSKSSTSKGRSVSRDGGRSSKDRSESKDSLHSGNSRMKNTEKQSLSRKGESSQVSRNPSSEKSVKPSHEAPRKPDTESSSRKSEGSSCRGSRSDRRETATVEIGDPHLSKKPSKSKPSGIEVNVQLLSRESLRSRSLQRSNFLGPYKLKQDRQPKNIDACSFLGIPINPATDTAKPKDSGSVERVKTSCAGTDKALKTKSDEKPELGQSAKTDKASAEKLTKEMTTSARDVKHSGARSGKNNNKEKDEKGKSRNERSSGSKDRGDNKGPSRDRGDGKGRQSNECEISIEIG